MFDALLTRVRGFFRRIFILPLWLAPWVVGLSFFWLFRCLTQPTSEPVRILNYHLSAYALVISVIWVMRMAPRVRRKRRWLDDLRRTPIGALLQNKQFRAWAAVYLSMAWNLVYALAKLLMGFALRSAWLQSMGVYYLVLAWLRFTIVRPPKEQRDRTYEWQRYRACGQVLLAMNAALILVVIQAVSGGSVRYPGPLIYLMAAYTFWALTSATVKLARSHRRNDPRMAAARAVSLTAAMVSLLSLEIALIDRFGSGDTAFRGLVISFTGSVVCTVELGLAFYMIRRGNAELKG